MRRACAMACLIAPVMFEPFRMNPSTRMVSATSSSSVRSRVSDSIQRTTVTSSAKLYSPIPPRWVRIGHKPLRPDTAGAVALGPGTVSARGRACAALGTFPLLLATTAA